MVLEARLFLREKLKRVLVRDTNWTSPSLRHCGLENRTRTTNSHMKSALFAPPIAGLSLCFALVNFHSNLRFVLAVIFQDLFTNFNILLIVWSSFRCRQNMKTAEEFMPGGRWLSVPGTGMSFQISRSSKGIEVLIVLQISKVRSMHLQSEFLHHQTSVARLTGRNPLQKERHTTCWSSSGWPRQRHLTGRCMMK